MYCRSVPNLWILKGHEPVEVDDARVWGDFLNDIDNRRVAETFIGDTRISTVFLGLNHNFTRGGPPLLFETMSFGSGDEYQYRYATWDEAVAGHNHLVAEERKRQGIPEPPPEPPGPPSPTAWERLQLDDDED